MVNKEDKYTTEECSNDTSIESKASSFLDKVFDTKTWIDGFNLTKENIGTALILISGLGAVVQIIELLKIDISYLRFFSVTQLAADGALAFITVLYSFIIHRLYLITYTNLQMIPELKRAIADRNDRFIPKELMHVVALLTAVTGAAIFLRADVFRDRVSIMFTLNAMMIATLYFTAKYFLLVRKHMKVNQPWRRDFWAINILVISSVAMTTFTVGKVASMYLELYRIPKPEELINYSYLEDRIERDYGVNKEYRILYFNDKYTFVDMKEKDKGIIIYKTDDVLFNVRHTVTVD